MINLLGKQLLIFRRFSKISKSKLFIRPSVSMEQLGPHQMDFD
jgi:hypothetical protein